MKCRDCGSEGASLHENYGCTAVLCRRCADMCDEAEEEDDLEHIDIEDE